MPFSRALMRCTTSWSIIERLDSKYGLLIRILMVLFHVSLGGCKVLMEPVCASLVVATRSSHVTDEAISGWLGRKKTPSSLVVGAGWLSFKSNLVIEIGRLDETIRPSLTCAVKQSRV